MFFFPLCVLFLYLLKFICQLYLFFFVFFFVGGRPSVSFDYFFIFFLVHICVYPSPVFISSLCHFYLFLSLPLIIVFTQLNFLHILFLSLYSGIHLNDLYIYLFFYLFIYILALHIYIFMVLPLFYHLNKGTGSISIFSLYFHQSLYYLSTFHPFYFHEYRKLPCSYSFT